MRLTPSRLSLCLGAALSAGLFHLPVMAQDTADNAQKLDRVEITGTRVKSLGAVSNSPITSVTAGEITASQPMAVEEVVRSLPTTLPAIGPGTNNGSGGFATIDLRGLGSNRSLVLINGRRLVPATLGGSVDTNAIPIALLDRVDLVTGGASAVYGADAVSGVVNFVTKRNFSGVQFTASYGLTEKGDAARHRMEATFGANLAQGRGNIVLSVGKTSTDPLRQGDRDFGQSSISSVNGLPEGSTTSVPAHWSVPNIRDLQVVDATTGRLRPAVQTDSYNFNPLNYFETPLNRSQITAMGRFQFSDHVEAYGELLHTQSQVVLNLAPTGAFTSTYRIPIGNPYIPQAVREQICAANGIAAARCVVGNTQEIPMQVRRRFSEFGPRVNDFDNKLTQLTLGLRGEIPRVEWSYDVYAQTGTADQVSAKNNWGSFSKLQQSLRAVSTTTCLNPANGCVPINIFGPDGSITKAAMDFVNLSAVQTTQVKQDVLAGSVNGEIGMLRSPLARSSLGMALGLEHRKVFGGNKSDLATQTQGEVLGAGAPTPDRSGTLELNEAYVEGIMPLINGRTLAESVNLELGYRHTQFKTATTSQTYGSWKYGLDWSPIKGLRLRGMQQRATRAPNVNELYAPVVTGLANLAVDPCQGNRANAADANRAGTLSNLCLLTGVPQSQLGGVPAPSAGQINSTSGGNPNLGPEEADTTTLGLVWEPVFVPGLTLTLDYYRIQISKAVSSPTAPQVMSGCYTTAQNPTLAYNAMCQLIQRDPTSGSLNGGAGVITQSSNLGKFDVSGVDLGAAYTTRLGADLGRLDMGLNFSLLKRWQFQSLPTVPVLDCLGVYGTSCGGPTPYIRFTQRSTWSKGDFSLGYVWRYMAGTVEEPGGVNYLPAYSFIKRTSYVDLNASWQATKNLSLSVSVNNALDKKPPMVGNTIATTTTNSGNTFPQWYDVLGRRYMLTLNAKF